jgi:hypothetical protein
VSDYTPGMFYDVGSAVALFWPDQHPELKEPAEQRWIVFDSWGGLEVITGRLPREDGVGREMGMVPFLVPSGKPVLLAVRGQSGEGSQAVAPIHGPLCSEINGVCVSMHCTRCGGPTGPQGHMGCFPEFKQ